MSNPFNDELSKRNNDSVGAFARPISSNPFASELTKRLAPPELSTAETLSDIGDSAIRGINKGLVGTLTLPYRAIDWVGEKLTGGDFLPNAEEMSLYKPFMQQPPAKTDAGRYAGTAGEVVGSSAIPSGALLGNAQRLSALAPTTLPRAVGQTIGSTIAARPGAAVAADIVSSTGAGIGQEAAKDRGFGETGQMVGGLLGGMTPFAVAAPFSAAKNTVRRARANADPYAKVAATLGEGQSIDDLAHSTAVGYSRIDPNDAYAQRVIDTLGEEMVRANGNRPQALASTIARLQVEGNVTEDVARAQLRRVVASQRDNELMLGEYPAVMTSNERTRRMTSPVLMREADYADSMPNRGAGNTLRAEVDPGRIEDSGMHWQLDTIANAGSGPSSQIIRTSVQDRLAALHNQMMSRIQSWTPNGAALADADSAVRRMTDAGRAAYRDVYDAPGGTAVDYTFLHRMLPRVVDRHLNRLAGFSGDQAEQLQKAINRLYLERPAGVVARADKPGLEDQLAYARRVVREMRRQKAPKNMIDDATRRAEDIAETLRLTRRDATPATQRYLMPTLEQLQNMRSAIRGDMDQFRNQGRGDMGVVLGPLYRDITRIMERASPRWRIANRQWADLGLADVARELGENISMQAGPNFRDQMRQFRQLAPEAQDFVRVEMAQKLIDKIINIGDGEDLAKLFKTPHIRSLVRTMFGDDAAVDMRRLIRDNRVATKTKNMMGGAPTQPRLARQQELDSDLGLMQATELPTTPSALIAALQKYTIGILRERRNRRIAGILTTPMRDTLAVAEHLERMRRARALASARSQAPKRQSGAAGLIGNILSSYGE